MSGLKMTTADLAHCLNQELRASHQKQKTFLNQRISFLTAEISEYAKREDDNKKINSMLMELLNAKQSMASSDKQSQLLALNSELRQQIVSNKKIHEQIVEHLQSQIKSLKQQLKLKEKEKQISQQNYILKTNDFQSKLSEMIAQNNRLQTSIDQLNFSITDRKQIIRKDMLYSSLRENGETTKRDLNKEQQLRNTSSIQSRVSSISDALKSSTDIDIQNNINEANEANMRRDRVRSYMKKGKGEIKMMMSTLLKTKGQLEEGYQNVTYIAQRQSLAGKTGMKCYKSFYQ